MDRLPCSRAVLGPVGAVYPLLSAGVALATTVIFCAWEHGGSVTDSVAARESIPTVGELAGLTTLVVVSTLARFSHDGNDRHQD